MPSPIGPAVQTSQKPNYDKGVIRLFVRRTAVTEMVASTWTVSLWFSVLIRSWYTYWASVIGALLWSRLNITDVTLRRGEFQTINLTLISLLKFISVTKAGEYHKRQSIALSRRMNEIIANLSAGIRYNVCAQNEITRVLDVYTKVRNTESGMVFPSLDVLGKEEDWKKE